MALSSWYGHTYQRILTLSQLTSMASTTLLSSLAISPSYSFPFWVSTAKSSQSFTQKCDWQTFAPLTKQTLFAQTKSWRTLSECGYNQHFLRPDALRTSLVPKHFYPKMLPPSLWINLNALQFYLRTTQLIHHSQTLQHFNLIPSLPQYLQFSTYCCFPTHWAITSTTILCEL